jgi:hypothetical protein
VWDIPLRLKIAEGSQAQGLMREKDSNACLGVDVSVNVWIELLIHALAGQVNRASLRTMSYVPTRYGMLKSKADELAVRVWWIFRALSTEAVIHTLDFSGQILWPDTENNKLAM